MMVVCLGASSDVAFVFIDLHYIDLSDLVYIWVIV